jgi:hypothetical protein
LNKKGDQNIQESFYRYPGGALDVTGDFGCVTVILEAAQDGGSKSATR